MADSKADPPIHNSFDMMMRIAIVLASVTIAVALSFGAPSDPDDPSFSESHNPVKTTSILLIRGPSAHSLSKNRSPRLRMILIIRRRLALPNSSFSPTTIDASKASYHVKRRSLWFGSNVLPPAPDFSHHLHGRDEHRHIHTTPSSDIKPDPELRHVRSGDQYPGDSDISRYAASFKNRIHETTGTAAVQQHVESPFLTRRSIFIALFVIASLCGLGLVILLTRPRNSAAIEVPEEADDKTYAPLLPPAVVTTA